MCNRLIKYFKLMEERPEFFSMSTIMNIETDITLIEKFEQETGKKIGVLYHSNYNILVVDLIQGEDKHYYTYERILPASNGVGIVVIAKYMNQFILLKQYRHALRDYQYGFIRGFGEDGISAKENAIKEIKEEINGEITNIQYLGDLTPDSGLTSNKVTYFLCELNSYSEKKGYEGIDSIITLSQNELEQWIKNGNITDGFTVAAYGLYLLKTTS